MSVLKKYIFTDKDGKSTEFDIGADAGNIDTEFTEASTRANITSGEKLSVILGKIKKFFADLLNGGASTLLGSNLTTSRALVSNTSGKVAVSAVTATQLGYLSGVTSNVQTQLNTKQASVTGGASSITSSNLTTNRALISNTSGKVAVSDVTATELGYLSGVTSNIQEQINNLKMFALQITFNASMKGQSFTVTGSGMTTYNGTVPDSLTATIAVPNANTTYTVKCDGKSKTITTGSYYGIYYGYVDTISTILSENSWSQIAAVSVAGNAENYWSVGDEIDIVVDGETLTLQIYGFNHDDLTGGGKAGITFGLKNLMAATRQMNSSDTNAGGFTGSTMYDWLQNTLYPLLPDDLKSAIKPVDKKTSAGQQSTTINVDSMKLFLFSVVECFGTTAYSVAGEGEVYPIFTDSTSRIKKLSNGTGSASFWWERSPYANNSTYFCYVYSNGNANYSNAGGSRGVCFGFCI